MKVIEEKDSSILRFANLFPQPAFPHGSEYREQYVQKYIDICNPNLLSMDTYPLANKSLNFFISLYDISLKSVENSVPFIYVLTPFKYRADWEAKNNPGNYTIPAKSLPEFRYAIYAALAYGAKGIGYWPGFTNVNNFGSHHFYLKYDTGVLEGVTALHKKLLDHSNELLSLNFAGAYHISNKSTIKDGYEEIHDFSLGTDKFLTDYRTKELFSGRIPLYDISTNEIPIDLMVTYMMNKTGQIYFWLFNKSFENPMNIRLNPAYSYFKDILNDKTLYYNAIITLEPREAKLFTPTISNSRWDEAFPAFNNIKIYDEGVYPLETFYRLDIGDEFSRVSFEKGAMKTFIADKIQIKSLHAKSGSVVRFKAYLDSNTQSNSASRISEKGFQNEVTDLIEECTGNSTIQFYPNPTDGIIYLISPDCIVEIYNPAGRKIGEYRNESEIDLSHLMPGIYVIKMHKKQEIHIRKIILTK